MIAGITRIADNPFNPIMAINFSKHVDYMVLAFDGIGGYKSGDIDGVSWFKLFEYVNPFHCKVDKYISKFPAGHRHLGDGFLDEMLRRLDGVKPEYVIECESDASFEYGNGWEEDWKAFVEGGYDRLMMMAKCVSADNRFIPDIPWIEHCRAYKWFEGITYYGGPGFCYPAPYPKPLLKNYKAKSKLLHFPLFTKEMESKRWEYYDAATTRIIYEKDQLVRLEKLKCSTK